MNSIQQNTEKGLDQSIMEWLSDHSTTILIISAVASFLITGFLEFFHYKEVFTHAIAWELAIAISILLPLFYQSVRCATIANSAKKFRQGERVRGSFVLLVSLGVTIFCSYEAALLSRSWEAGHPEIAGVILLATQCLVWAGWVLEIILVISVAGGNPNQRQQNRFTRSNPVYEEEEAFELNPLLNGNDATP